MDEPTLARIFEPFFTTKDVGQGTGLGLATVYAIIKHHRGIIRADSQPGRGTTFHIFLPVSAKAVVAEPSRDESLLRGTGTVLLVDDEDGIRMVAGRLLQQLGYQTLLAPSGLRALEIYRQEGERIDLVILDMLMPGMGGAETFQKLKGSIRSPVRCPAAIPDGGPTGRRRGPGFIQPWAALRCCPMVAEILARS
jgi:hypothetical protein